MSWFGDLDSVVQPDVPLSDYTWYGLGGPARWFVTPRDDDELATLLTRLADAGIPWRVLGRGANLIVADQGFAGAVIHLTGPHWQRAEFVEDRVSAAAGADFPKLVKQAVDRGLAGLEGLAGIPGSLGGIIRMNAGGRHGNIADCVVRARLMSPDGTVHSVPRDNLGFAYRTSAIGDRIVLGATLKLEPTDLAPLLERYRAIWSAKHASQPPVSAKSAGCIFKNPPHQAAGAILDQLGLKGTRRGGAEISPRHANFILAHPGATAHDVVELIQYAKDRVQSETGITLELEVEIW
jgi:UDP-N-acetylmuramate dehydrogenase